MIARTTYIADLIQRGPARRNLVPRGLLCLGWLVLGPILGAAQPEGRGPSQAPGSAIMIESFARGPADSARGLVDIFFRIEAGFFVPVRNTDTDAAMPYVRRGEVLIELIDSTGMSRARDLARLERGGPENELLRPGTVWFQGGFTVGVPYGTYTMLVEVTDSESQRSTTDRSRHVRVQPQAAGPEGDAAAIFVETPAPGSSRDTLRIHNYGGDVLFGSGVSMYVELPKGSPADSSIDVAVRYEMVRPGEDDAVFVRADTALGIRPILRNRPAQTSDTLGMAYVTRGDQQPQVRALEIPLGTQRLPLRRYRLTAAVIRGSEPLTFKREFRMIWPDMPRSLRNVDDAITALRYIAPEATVDSLLEGPLEARWAHLEGFWKPRDRSPDTAPNEVMTEYYRRVDHARETFGTLRQQDGFLTDRGRIYVLHGPPTNTERSLDPTEGFREVWTYARGNKTFIFVDRTKTGDYILLQRPAQ
jgi:GWxTD domain-containing protein